MSGRPRHARRARPGPCHSLFRGNAGRAPATPVRAQVGSEAAARRKHWRGPDETKDVVPGASHFCHAGGMFRPRRAQPNAPQDSVKGGRHERRGDRTFRAKFGGLSRRIITHQRVATALAVQGEGPEPCPWLIAATLVTLFSRKVRSPRAGRCAAPGRAGRSRSGAGAPAIGRIVRGAARAEDSHGESPCLLLEYRIC